MDNIWNYKIDIIDESVFDKLETILGRPVPSNLREFVIMANGSNPEHNLININGVERVFETVLSFNEAEEDAVTVFQMIDGQNDKSLIPFGLDPFGNVFCYSLDSNTVVFFEYEEDTFVDSEYSLSEFVSELY